jgi:hypothetical protein
VVGAEVAVINTEVGVVKIGSVVAVVVNVLVTGAVIVVLVAVPVVEVAAVIRLDVVALVVPETVETIAGTVFTTGGTVTIPVEVVIAVSRSDVT